MGYYEKRQVPIYQNWGVQWIWEDVWVEEPGDIVRRKAALAAEKAEAELRERNRALAANGRQTASAALQNEAHPSLDVISDSADAFAAGYLGKLSDHYSCTLNKVETVLRFIEDFDENEKNIIVKKFYEELAFLEEVAPDHAEHRRKRAEKQFPDLRLRKSLQLTEQSADQGGIFQRCRRHALIRRAKEHIATAGIAMVAVASVAFQTHGLGFLMGGRKSELPEAQIVSDEEIPIGSQVVYVDNISTPWLSPLEEERVGCRFIVSGGITSRPEVNRKDSSSIFAFPDGLTSRPEVNGRENSSIFVSNTEEEPVYIQYRNGAEVSLMRETAEFEVPAKGTIELKMKRSNFPPHLLEKDPRIQCLGESVWAQRNKPESQVRVVGR